MLFTFSAHGYAQKMTSTPFRHFPDTHWSLVRRAGFAEGQIRQEALATLLNRYEPALFSYLRFVRRMSEEQAKDLLQEFIADKILEYELLKHAHEGRGRFRSFLLACLNHFAVDCHRANNRSFVEFDLPPDKLGQMQTSHAAPAIFEAAWARALIHAVLETMRKECELTNRMDVWTVFENRILVELFERKKPLPYERLAKELEIGSPTQAANLLVTGKRMYARLLRAAVAEYELDGDEIEAEISDLCRALEVPQID